MEIERLKTFLSVVQYGSFQRAAAHAYLSQRAVSKQITNMERELGVTLFQRGQNRIALTAQGRLFLSSAQDIVNNYTNTVAELQHTDHSETNHLRVGYFSLFDQQLLQKALFEMLDNGLNIDLTVKEGSNEHLTQMVTDGDLDVALSISYGHPDLQVDSSITVRSIFKGTMVMGISKLNPLSHAESLEASDLSSLPILYYSAEVSTFLLESFLASAPFIKNFEQIRRVSSIEQMNMLVALNKALAFYPQGLLSSTLNNQYIKLLPLRNNNNQNYTVSVLYNSKNKSQILKQLLAKLDAFNA